MSSALFALGRACHRHRGRVVAVWALLLLMFGAFAFLFGKGTTEVYTVPGSESQQALDDVEGRFPEIAGTSAQIVAVSQDGARIDRGAHRTRIAQAVDDLEDVDGVSAVTDPFSDDVTGAVSDDHRAAVITVQLDASSATLVPDETKDALVEQTERLRDPGLRAEYGGSAFAGGAPTMSWVEGLGVILAGIVLFLYFRRLRAAAAPIVTAGAAAGVTGSLIMIATAFVEITGTSPLLALMLGMAVGIDYALFLLSRFRENLHDGVPSDEAAARATATAGAAVVFAGFTVIVALLGLVIVGLPFLSAMGVSAALGVAVAVAASLTLCPALMSMLGPRFARARTPRVRRFGRRKGQAVAPWARTWVRVVTRVPLLTVLVVTAALAMLAVPAKDMRLALPDNGTLEPGTSPRMTYDLIDEHFGPGTNGPLLVVADIVTSNDPLGLMDRLRDDFERVDGVREVTLSTPNRKADTGVVVVVPETGPAEEETAELVHRLRDRAAELGAREQIAMRVTGATAVQIDVSEKLSRALLPFGIVVMGLSLLLLVVVFRSFVVPLTATLGFLLSVGAAFGVVSAVFSWGWAADALNVTRTGPVISFMPIILMGVLFGLAMDYQMFIVSRMHEHYVHNRDPRAAVEEGFVSAAPVVAAAGLIMAGVFAAFVPEADTSLKPIALGLTVGVLVDAFIVRMILVPAFLRLFGHASWAMPARLAELLPHLDVEGQGVMHQIAAAEEIKAAPDRVVHARGLTMEGPRGTIYAPFDLDLCRGQIGILHGPDGTGKTSALLTLAGRMPGHDGELDVAGAVLPEQHGTVQSRVTLSEMRGINDFDPDLSVEQHIAERLATVTLMPWAPKAKVRDILARMDEAVDVALRAGGARGGAMPTFIDPSMQIQDLTRLQRKILGVVLASLGDPALIVVDDADDLRTHGDRAGFWAVLGRLARGDGHPAVLAACQDRVDPNAIARTAGLDDDDVVVVELPVPSNLKVMS